MCLAWLSPWDQPSAASPPVWQNASGLDANRAPTARRRESNMVGNADGQNLVITLGGMGLCPRGRPRARAWSDEFPSEHRPSATTPHRRLPTATPQSVFLAALPTEENPNAVHVRCQPIRAASTHLALHACKLQLKARHCTAGSWAAKPANCPVTSSSTS